MTAPEGRPPRLYGTAEIAELLDVKPDTVRKWVHRGRMPPPDVQLAMGGVWYSDTVWSWIGDRRR